MAIETSDLFDQWFRIADSDRDGRISGPEAVTFFQRSRLSQDTLFKVWKLVAGDSSHLTKPQFWASLRLVSLAQKHQGQLPEAEARSTLIGVGPALPPPLLAGLETSGGQTASQNLEFQGYPQLQQSSLQRYLHLFSQLDHERSGVVQGGSCFGTFMQWGLPRQVLKDIWQVVAGDQSFLKQQQFVSCLYLMDLAKQGRPVPAQLPQGPFPPGYAAAQQNDVTGAPAGFNLGSVQHVQHDVFSNDLPTPSLPQKAVFTAPATREAPSQVPHPTGHMLEALDPLQKQRLQNDAAQAASMEAELRKAEKETAEAIAKEAFFREALQQLTLFKSRTSAALLQAQEHLQSANTEASAMEANYQSAWTSAQATQSKSTALLEQLSEAKSRKAESRRKLEDLQNDIKALSSISEDQIEAERQAVAELQKEVAKAEAEREQRLQKRDTLLAGRDSLREELEKLQADLAGAATTIESTEKEMEDLIEKLEGGDDSAALRLQALLRKSAAMHKTLLAHACKGDIAIPDDDATEEDDSGQPSLERFSWPQFIALGARDWDADLKGPELVDSLPSADRLLDPTAGVVTQDQEPPEVVQDSHNSTFMDSTPQDITGNDSWAAF